MVTVVVVVVTVGILLNFLSCLILNIMRISVAILIFVVRSETRFNCLVCETLITKSLTSVIEVLVPSLLNGARLAWYTVAYPCQTDYYV